MLDWDPGNAAARGENAYPDGYATLPKDRIGHMHCKDVVLVGDARDGKTEWAANHAQCGLARHLTQRAAGVENR